MTSRSASAFMAAAILWAGAAAGGEDSSDWPMWRHDPARSGTTAHALPEQLYLHWVHREAPLERAWRNPINQERMTYDRCYEPVVTGKTLLYGSGDADRLVAVDTETGTERWRFYTDGPIRFAPVCRGGRVWLSSDDGCLYCLSADDGSLIWRFRGGPSRRTVLGNERLVSMWPARGGPVLAGERIYFAAGIWPFMGIFIHCLDAETGEAVWTNDGSSHEFTSQPHDSPAFAGVAPQGCLAASGGRLIVPGGRSVPAGYDLDTGRFLYYRLAEEGQCGGSAVSASRHFFFNGGRAFFVADGSWAAVVDGEIVVDSQTLYVARSGQVTAYRMVEGDVEKGVWDSTAKAVKQIVVKGLRLDKLWSTPVGEATALIKAGPRLYAGSKGEVRAMDADAGGAGRIHWRAGIEGTPASLVAADSKLFVSTLEGSIFCFGAGRSRPRHYTSVPENSVSGDRTSGAGRAIVEATGMTEGYCVAFGVGTGDLIEDLARSSKLRIVAVEPDAKKAEAARRKLDALGLYGRRVAVIRSAPAEIVLPPYVASLIVCEDPAAAGFASDADLVDKSWTSLRPYGGVLCAPAAEGREAAFRSAAAGGRLPGAKVVASDRHAMLLRQGSLPGSAPWTHLYGDAANTVTSKDDLVKLPLGMLWFGGSSHNFILPRHGHGPSEQVLDGRLVIEGPEGLRALDVYTGRVLWDAKLPGIGRRYDTTLHQPGAMALGTNYVLTPEAVYVAYGDRCLVLDPATGRKASELKLPGGGDWWFMAAAGELLVAGEAPQVFDVSRHDDKEYRRYSENFDYTSSRSLVAMERRTGRVLWRLDSKGGFRHNAVAIGGGKLFAIDRLPDQVTEAMAANRGQPPAARLVAVDLAGGVISWTATEGIFGTWLGYSAEHDVLIEAGRNSNDMIAGEARNQMKAYRGSTGQVLWHRPAGSPQAYNGPVMIRGTGILSLWSSFDLLTGEHLTRTHPMTGKTIDWDFTRRYGCGTSVAGKHLLTFRSAAAGYYDLDRDGGTGNFGGFKSGCTSNLIPADGVLNAPDYTRTCTCSYQNQCSLALVHMPDEVIELWQEMPYRSVDARVRRVGVNLGAPGDRMADDGTLWLDVPPGDGRSPDLKVTVGGGPVYFRRHSSAVWGAGHKWVAASGAEGVTSVEIDLGGAGTYSVRLYFLDPSQGVLGRRVFDVALNGKVVENGLDVAKAAGGRLVSVVKEFRGLALDGSLTVTLVPREGSLPPVLSGVEIVDASLPLGELASSKAPPARLERPAGR